MRTWLDRLRRWGVRLAAAAGVERDASPIGPQLIWEGPENGEQGAADVAAPSAPRTSAMADGPRFSVWERLAGDPAAAAVRAKWESRWDEF